MGEEAGEGPDTGRETVQIRAGDPLIAGAITGPVLAVGMLLLSLRAQGYLLGEGRDDHESLEQEWPGMIGFREGPLSEARTLVQAAEQDR